MLATAAACAHQSGVAELLFGHCPAMSDVGAMSLFRPWAVLEPLRVVGACKAGLLTSLDCKAACLPMCAPLYRASLLCVHVHRVPLWCVAHVERAEFVLRGLPGVNASAGCWVGAASEALLAAGAMLLAGRYLAGSGALVGAHGAPLRKVALSLGAGCGAAGYFVVARLHGRPARCVARRPLDAAAHDMCRFWPRQFPFLFMFLLAAPVLVHAIARNYDMPRWPSSWAFRQLLESQICFTTAVLAQVAVGVGAMGHAPPAGGMVHAWDPEGAGSPQQAASPSSGTHISSWQDAAPQPLVISCTPCVPCPDGAVVACCNWRGCLWEPGAAAHLADLPVALILLVAEQTRVISLSKI